MSRAVRVLLTPLLAGVLVATLVMGAWAALGLRAPAKGGAWFSVVKTGEAHFTGSPTEPFFVLVVGNDAREGLGGARGDAVHLVGVNPAAKSATILDIPRDTNVNIPGRGSDKITHALVYGGLPLMVETVEQWVGVSIPYAITTNFEGFRNMVDDIGGVDITIQQPMHDSNSGTNFEPGPAHLDGHGALAFNRDRYSFGTGDLQRSENQGYFLISTLATLRSRNPSAAGTMRMLVSLVRNTQHEGLSLTEMYRLGSLALSIDPANVRNVLLPGDPGSLFADLADDGLLQTH